MSLFSAFGKASLNFVTKLGEIVAPIDDDDEIKEANSKVESEDSKLIKDSNLITESGDSPSIMQQLTSISSANLSKVFNDVISDGAPANQSVTINRSPVDNSTANVSIRPYSSSCMEEVELDESFESTPFKSRPLEQILVGAPSLQHTQHRSQSNDSDGSEELFLGGQPAHTGKQQSSFLPPSQKQPAPFFSSIKINGDNQSAVVQPSSQSKSESNSAGSSAMNHDHVKAATDLPGAAPLSKLTSFAPFESIVNSFPVYKPHSAVDTANHSAEHKHQHQHQNQHKDGSRDQQGQSLLGIEEKVDAAHRMTERLVQGCSSSSSSSGSYNDKYPVQKSTIDDHGGDVHKSIEQSSSSSSSNYTNNNYMTQATPVGHSDYNRNGIMKDEKGMSHQQTLEKSTESVLFIDEPPEGGNQALKAQLGTQTVIPYVHLSKSFTISVVLVYFMRCLSLHLLACNNMMCFSTTTCAVLCCAVLCCAVQCCAVQCCAVLLCIVLCNTVLDLPCPLTHYLVSSNSDKSMCEVERLISEAARNIASREEAAASAMRSEALLQTERLRLGESSGRLLDMEQEFKDLYMRMGRQGELLLEAEMQKDKMTQKIDAMNQERETERATEKDRRIRESEKEKEMETVKQKQDVFENERHQMQQKINLLGQKLSLAIAAPAPIPSFSHGQEREKHLEKELEEMKAARNALTAQNNLNERSIRDLYLKIAEVEKDKVDCEERLVKETASTRCVVYESLPSLSSPPPSLLPSLPPPSDLPSLSPLLPSPLPPTFLPSFLFSS